jgi:Fe-S-cluster containining protein
VALDDGTTLEFVDGRCPRLDEAGRCRIYETRPKGCRAFDCAAEPGYLRMQPQVAALLTLRRVPVLRLSDDPNWM